MSYKSKKVTPVKSEATLTTATQDELSPVPELITTPSDVDVIDAEAKAVKRDLIKNVETDESLTEASKSSEIASNQTDDGEDKPLKTTPVDNIKPLSFDILEGFTLLIESGKALKLSPKTQNHVFYQLAEKEDDKSLHIRMSGNEGGGLHSKLWVSINAITDLLDGQIDKTIKSTLLKPVFQGGSANNCGFMCAVLRSTEIGLLTQADKSVFVHRLSSDYQANKVKLLALVK